MQVHIVKYSGAFGYIKPWTAVRDSETFSQQFLTPSIVEGIEKKLFPELLNHYGLANKICRHRINYSGTVKTKEMTQSRNDFTPEQRKQIVTNQYKLYPLSNKNEKRRFNQWGRQVSVIDRVLLIEPTLFLAFSELNYAERASTQHICLCRNEDVMLPSADILSTTEEEFDAPANGFDGFELRFGETPESFIVGYNRFDAAKPMVGWLHIVGNPIRQTEPA